MEKSYDYVAPDYRIRFGMSGDWFWFQDKSFGIGGDLKTSGWELEFRNLNTISSCAHPMMIFDIPYETLVSFRKALSIKGLGFVLDKEITLIDEK